MNFAYCLWYRIEAFGGPKEVGEAIVKTVTRSSQRTDLKGTLLEANLRQDSERNLKYYELDFKVESPSFRRHNVAVCCVNGGRLYTLNAQAPESAWPELKHEFHTVAKSFNIISWMWKKTRHYKERLVLFVHYHRWELMVSDFRHMFKRANLVLFLF